MGTNCMGVCLRLANVKYIGSGGGFREKGKKRCTICEIVIETNDVKCPCCNMRLRIRKDYRNNEKKVLLRKSRRLLEQRISRL